MNLEFLLIEYCKPSKQNFEKTKEELTKALTDFTGGTKNTTMLFRGGNKNGLSWTVDPNVAQAFGSELHWTTSPIQVIPMQHYTDYEFEKEVIIPPSELKKAETHTGTQTEMWKACLMFQLEWQMKAGLVQGDWDEMVEKIDQVVATLVA